MNEGMLNDLKLESAYHKGRDDIAGSFYLPCMNRSVRYDRAVGYFSSSIYLLAWESLSGFVRRGGRIRIICSPFLSATDIGALNQAYEARHQDEFETRLVSR